MNPAVLLLLASLTTGQAKPEPLVVESAILSLLDQREAPAREAGVLDQMLVKELQTVVAGQSLAVIDSVDAVLEVERSEAHRDNASGRSENDSKVKFAEKELELARYEVKRLTDRIARFPDSASPEELERRNIQAEKSAAALQDAQLEFKAAKYELRIAEADLKLAERKVDRHRIVSPIDGVVVKIARRAGEWVQPGEIVFRILRLDKLKAEGFIPATLAPPDLIGRRAALKIAGDDTPHFGRVLFVSPEVNPADGTTRIWAEIDNPGRQLRPGQRGTLVIAPE
ncbi:efflux RND transporter periplasmic adaptor subunit [Lignipirellula cremea]|uniref:Cobalt-zinc-cadmium resistance protein CzcB n=1 Tax=Lignipirellula cremea TaxID=2528010 RepID=A0A518E0G8_9BACT|nr:HlyD family efflux transporter periplasmic adaptor subunit [Lignipirellula cremea]QDU97573.1 Cobalt-zinc-cadmium resistance protein CzcB [Lignipirellula cremea]